MNEWSVLLSENTAGMRVLLLQEIEKIQVVEELKYAELWYVKWAVGTEVGWFELKHAIVLK